MLIEGDRCSVLLELDCRRLDICRMVGRGDAIRLINGIDKVRMPNAIERWKGRRKTDC